MGPQSQKNKTDGRLFSGTLWFDFVHGPAPGTKAQQPADAASIPFAPAKLPGKPGPVNHYSITERSKQHNGKGAFWRYKVVEPVQLPDAGSMQ